MDKVELSGAEESSLPDFFSKEELMKHDTENNSQATPATMSSESIEYISSRNSSPKDLFSMVTRDIGEKKPTRRRIASKDDADGFQILSTSGHKLTQSPGVHHRKKLSMNALLSPHHAKSRVNRSSFAPRGPKNLQAMAAFHSSLRSIGTNLSNPEFDTNHKSAPLTGAPLESSDDEEEEDFEEISEPLNDQDDSKKPRTSLNDMFSNDEKDRKRNGMKRAKSIESMQSMESWFSNPFGDTVEPQKPKNTSTKNNLGDILENEEPSPTGMRKSNSVGSLHSLGLSNLFPDSFNAFRDNDKAKETKAKQQPSQTPFGINSRPSLMTGSETIETFHQSFREALTLDPFSDDHKSFSELNQQFLVDDDDDDSSADGEVEQNNESLLHNAVPVQPKKHKLKNMTPTASDNKTDAFSNFANFGDVSETFSISGNGEVSESFSVSEANGGDADEHDGDAKEGSERRRTLELSLNEIMKAKQKNQTVLMEKLDEKDQLIASLAKQLEDLSRLNKSQELSTHDDCSKSAMSGKSKSSKNSKTSKGSLGTKTKKSKDKLKSATKEITKKKKKKKSIKNFAAMSSARVEMTGDVRVEASPSHSKSIKRLSDEKLRQRTSNLNDVSSLGTDDTDGVSSGKKTKRRSSHGTLREPRDRSKKSEPKRVNSVGTLKGKSARLERERSKKSEPKRSSSLGTLKAKSQKSSARKSKKIRSEASQFENSMQSLLSNEDEEGTSTTKDEGEIELNDSGGSLSLALQRDKKKKTKRRNSTGSRADHVKSKREETNSSSSVGEEEDGADPWCKVVSSSKSDKSKTLTKSESNSDELKSSRHRNSSKKDGQSKKQKKDLLKRFKARRGSTGTSV